MSGVAGLVHWDGRPVEPGVVEAMTGAMRHRGPDGIEHWRSGSVAAGQCLLRTTPESLEEHLPMSSDDGQLLLVVDGRVDNAPELRRALAGKGAVIRSRADAELVLRAYEVWGEDCCAHIVGECVFLIWDARRKVWFGARDAAGTRHFYYLADGNRFAFASETRGLLALPGVEQRLNEFRVLDYLIEEFDRTNQVESFFQGIWRLPAGHALRASERGVETWRWWRPAELAPQHFASLAECTEAFMAQLEEVVKPRLRSLKPVGCMLSGGMDSSTLVGLISHRLRGELAQPLHTVSLIRDDRDNCTDWQSIQAILAADPWLQPTVLTTAKVDEVWEQLLALAARTDDPFGMANGLTYHLTYQAAHEAGCGVLLDGMAGDMLFHDGQGTLEAVVRRRLWHLLPGLRQTYRNHQWPMSLSRDLLTMALRVNQPDWVRGWVRRRRDARRLDSGDLVGVPPQLARDYLESRRSPAYRSGAQTWQPDEQADHAARFTSGLNSFGHETYGPLAFACGVEPRSPYSDRRLIEFGIRMPLEAKLAIPWYKQLLRAGTERMLPEATRERRDIGSHPGWTYFERLARYVPARPVSSEPVGWSQRWFESPLASGRQTVDGADASSREADLRRALLWAWLRSMDPP
ncbi:MAG: hypothetical protein KDF54_14125 [Hydrogenophaga sp.]|nr:hypothetical protein [Hydrogenophaga sp.]